MKRNISLNIANAEYKPQGPINTGHWVTRPGYGTLRQHGTQDWLVIYTMNGTGRIGYKGGPLLTRAGDMLLWYPGSFHDYRISRNSAGWEIIWAHFMARPHWHEFINWPQKADGPRFLHIDDRTIRQQVARSLQAMHAYANGPLERGKLLAINELEKALLLADLSNPGVKQARLDPRIRLALDILCQNSAESLPLKSVADQCGCSLSRFAHLFSEQMGLTPVAYREQQRILQAKRLLESTTFSIKEIAEMTGFNSQFYFSRRFRQATGLSPRSFREAGHP